MLASTNPFILRNSQIDLAAKSHKLSTSKVKLPRGDNIDQLIMCHQVSFNSLRPDRQIFSMTIYPQCVFSSLPTIYSLPLANGHLLLPIPSTFPSTKVCCKKLGLCIICPKQDNLILAIWASNENSRLICLMIHLLSWLSMGF